jgi:photosystem II stability/assembly factor-like uncharacterized protein
MKVFKHRMKRAGFLLVWLILFFSKGIFAQWNTVYSTSNAQPHKLQFLNPDTAYALFNGPLLVKTVNAGSSWIAVDSNYFDTGGVEDVSFLNSTEGFMIYGYNGAMLFKKTTDGGINWSAPQTLPYVTKGYVHFISSDTGFIAGAGSIIRTVDGGISWNLMYNNSTIYINSIDFTSDTTGYVSAFDYTTSQGLILKTTNAGGSWSSMSNSFSGKIKFINPDTGFVFGGKNIYKTNNGGSSWTLKYLSPPSFMEITDISFPVADTGYAVATNYGQPATLLITTDGGNTWKGYGACEGNAAFIHFTNPNTGYVLSDLQIDKTITGGFSCPGIMTELQIDNLVASGDSVSLIAYPSIVNNYAYSWSPAIFMNDSTLQFPKFSNETPGSLTQIFVTLTDTIWGCPPVTAQTSVYTFPDYTGIVSGGNDTIVCGGDYNSFHLTATTNWNDSVCNFQWQIEISPGVLNMTYGQDAIIPEGSNQECIINVVFPDETQVSDTVYVTVHYSFNDTVFHCEAPATIGLPDVINSSFAWSTGDTVNTINVNQEGTYSCTATYSNPGCIATSGFIVVDSCSITSAVWPGDTNNDLIVNNYDVLNVGLTYGYTGPIRPMNSWFWSPQEMTDWPQFLSSGLNYKYADCSGDGFINLFDDTVILYNYNYTHPPARMVSNLRSRNAADLYLVAQYDTVGLQATVNFAIMLGNTGTSIDSIYGIAYSLSYDQDLTYQPMTVNYNNSWFGDPGTTTFSFEKPFHSDGYIDLALSRKDHMNTSGDGQIGNAIIVTTDNVSGIYSVLNVDIYDVRAVTKSGTIIDLTTAGDSVVISSAPFSVFEQDNISSAINVYPNPNSGIINVSSTNKNIEQIVVYNTLGKPLYIKKQSGMNQVVDLSELENGIYFISVHTGNGIANKRITISK